MITQNKQLFESLISLIILWCPDWCVVRFVFSWSRCTPVHSVGLLLQELDPLENALVPCRYLIIVMH
jgi:hypothetical protein